MERAELRKSLAELDGRKQELDDAERQLGFRQQEINTALERYERLGVTEERLQQLQEEARKFAARRRYLDEAESQLTQEKAGARRPASRAGQSAAAVGRTDGARAARDRRPGAIGPGRPAATRCAARAARSGDRRPRERAGSNAGRASSHAARGARNAAGHRRNLGPIVRRTGAGESHAVDLASAIQAGRPLPGRASRKWRIGRSSWKAVRQDLAQQLGGHRRAAAGAGGVGRASAR